MEAKAIKHASKREHACIRVRVCDWGGAGTRRIVCAEFREAQLKTTGSYFSNVARRPRGGTVDTHRQ